MKTVNSWLSTICVVIVSLFVGLHSAIAAPALSHAPASATAEILEPSDGDTVATTFTVKFGLSEMGVAPAGIDKENTGHHHLLIDLEELPSLTDPLPSTEHIRHFGGGQTETELTLSPGPHTLQLVLGNYQHIPHDHPVLSEPITVEASDA